MIKTLLFAAAAALSTAACTGHATVRARYAAPAPELVYVSPGVYVIADYDYPVFYSDNAYWRYDGGVWYRSPTYTGGWRMTTRVPVAVRTIDRPHAYVRYRGNVRVAPSRGYAPVQARDHRHGRR